jgi:hypothetical protein
VAYGHDPDRLLGRYQPRGAVGYDKQCERDRAAERATRLRIVAELALLGASRRELAAVLGCKLPNVTGLCKEWRDHPIRELRRYLPSLDVDSTLESELKQIAFAIEDAEAQSG